MLTTRPALYDKALAADDHLSATITRYCGTRTRWTITAKDLLILEVREALAAKLDADREWLNYMRRHR